MMREDVKEVLKKNNVKVELKGYKEMQALDGYHMRGTLYVNNKRAILCEDFGDGGGCDIDILNKNNAKPLLDINGDLNKIKAYPGNKTIGDLPYKIENMFYDMATDFLENRALKRGSKTKTFVRFPGNDEGKYNQYSYEFGNFMIVHLLQEMKKNGYETIDLWNIEKEWTTYTYDELKKELFYL